MKFRWFKWGWTKNRKKKSEQISYIFYTGTITGKKDTLQNPISATNYHNIHAKKLTQD